MCNADDDASRCWLGRWSTFRRCPGRATAGRFSSMSTARWLRSRHAGSGAREPALLPLLVRLRRARTTALGAGQRPRPRQHRCPVPPVDAAAAGLHGWERRRADGISTAPRPASRPRSWRRCGRGSPHSPRPVPASFRGQRRQPGAPLPAGAAIRRRRLPLSPASLPPRSRGLRLIEGRRSSNCCRAGSDKGEAIAEFLAEPPFAGRDRSMPATTRPTRTASSRSAAGAASRYGSVLRRRDSGKVARLPTVEAVLAWLASSGLR